MKSAEAGAAVTAYNSHLAAISQFEAANRAQLDHLETLRQSEMAKVNDMMASAKAFASQNLQAVQAAVQELNSNAVGVTVDHVQPAHVPEDMTVSQVAEQLGATAQRALAQGRQLPRLRARHAGMQKDIVIVPLVALLCVFFTFMTISTGNALTAPWIALMGAGAAALVVKVSGGGWTFRRLGGQDYTPRRPGQKTGSGALAAFLTCLGVTFVVWGLFTPPTGLFWGLLMGGGLLVKPALRARDVITVEEQEPK